MKSSAVVLTIVFCTGYWLTRSSWLPRPASPASTTKVETVHPHGCGKLFPLLSCGLSVTLYIGRKKCPNFLRKSGIKHDFLRLFGLGLGPEPNLRYFYLPERRRETLRSELLIFARTATRYFAFNFTACLTLHQRVALIVSFLAAGNCNLNLCLAVIEVQLQRDKSDSTFFNLYM